MKLRRLEIFADQVESEYFKKQPPSGVLRVEEEISTHSLYAEKGSFKSTLGIGEYTITGVEGVNDQDVKGTVASSQYIATLKEQITSQQGQIIALQKSLKELQDAFKSVEMIYTVNDQGGDFRTIQECLNFLNKTTRPANNIVMQVSSSNGKHAENVMIDRLPFNLFLTIQATEGTVFIPDTASNTQSIITIDTANRITIKGDMINPQKSELHSALRIKHQGADVSYDGTISGNATYEASNNFLHGIYVEGAERFVFSGVVQKCGVAYSQGLKGSGVYLSNVKQAIAQGEIRECRVVSDNFTSCYGAGLYLSKSNAEWSGLISYCQIDGPVIACGGGVYVDGSSKLMMSGTISYCATQKSSGRSVSQGGGIYIDGGSVTMTGNLEHCTSLNGGGGYYNDRGQMDFSGQTIDCTPPNYTH